MSFDKTGFHTSYLRSLLSGFELRFRQALLNNAVYGINEKPNSASFESSFSLPLPTDEVQSPPSASPCLQTRYRDLFQPPTA